jgi:hypothetical protein
MVGALGLRGLRLRFANLRRSPAAAPRPPRSLSWRRCSPTAPLQRRLRQSRAPPLGTVARASHLRAPAARYGWQAGMVHYCRRNSRAASRACARLVVSHVGQRAPRCPSRSSFIRGDAAGGARSDPVISDIISSGGARLGEIQMTSSGKCLNARFEGSDRTAPWLSRKTADRCRISCRRWRARCRLPRRAVVARPVHAKQYPGC